MAQDNKAEPVLQELSGKDRVQISNPAKLRKITGGIWREVKRRRVQVRSLWNFYE